MNPVLRVGCKGGREGGWHTLPNKKKKIVEILSTDASLAASICTLAVVEKQISPLEHSRNFPGNNQEKSCEGGVLYFHTFFILAVYMLYVRRGGSYYTYLEHV